MKTCILFLAVFLPGMVVAQWEKIDSVFNPSGVSVQNFSSPEFSDLNGDGKIDLLLGNSSSSRTGFFRNLGAGTPPRFTADTSMLSSIYAGGYVGTNSDYPTVIDLDADGDSDLVIGGYNGLLLYWNAGDTLVPVWQKDTVVFASVNPFIGTDAKPAFADLDGDGDRDLLVGIGESLFGGPTPGITLGFRNNGTPAQPIFAQDSALVAGISDVGLNSFPALKDIDADGDVDLLIGRDLASLVYFRNTGSAAAPVWTGNSTTFAGVEANTYWKTPTLFDLDNDGDPDLTYGTSDGTLYFYENTGSPANPQFQQNAEYFAVIRLAGNGATVSLADFDNDGDVDMVSGDWLGKFQYFRNDGTPAGPRFTRTAASFSSIDVGSYSSPVFVDLDGDGDKDIVSGALDGMIYYYVNTGTGFTQNTGTFAGIDVGWRSAPAFADIDADGDMDMIVGAEDASAIQFYRNQGRNLFVQDNTVINGVLSTRDGHPTFVDLDRDGDFDLILGGSSGQVWYYENVGTSTNPVWSRNDARLAGIGVRQDATPACADFDGDGDADMILGEYNGNFSYYRNLVPTSVAGNGDATPRGFELHQNYPNPFNPETTIEFAVPAGLARSGGGGKSGVIHVTLKVFDILGREVTTLVNEEKPVGHYSVVFNAGTLSSGTYYCRLHSGDFVAVRPMLLIR